MRTTINISDASIIQEAEILYNTKNRSKAIENAIKDAIRFHKLKELIKLKTKIKFDEANTKSLRNLEMSE